MLMNHRQCSWVKGHCWTLATHLTFVTIHSCLERALQQLHLNAEMVTIHQYLHLPFLFLLLKHQKPRRWERVMLQWKCVFLSVSSPSSHRPSEDRERKQEWGHEFAVCCKPGVRRDWAWVSVTDNRNVEVLARGVKGFTTGQRGRSDRWNENNNLKKLVSHWLEILIPQHTTEWLDPAW